MGGEVEGIRAAGGVNLCKVSPQASEPSGAAMVRGFLGDAGSERALQSEQELDEPRGERHSGERQHEQRPGGSTAWTRVRGCGWLDGGLGHRGHRGRWALQVVGTGAENGQERDEGRRSVDCHWSWGW